MVICLAFSGTGQLLAMEADQKHEAEAPASYAIHVEEMPIIPTEGISIWPEQLRKGVKGRELIGSANPKGPGDAKLLYTEFAPGTLYPLHVHDQSEIYYILSGKATFHYDEVYGGDIAVEEKMAIHHPGGHAHGLTVQGDEPLKVLIFWWAQGGDPEMIGRNYRLLNQK